MLVQGKVRKSKICIRELHIIFPDFLLYFFIPWKAVGKSDIEKRYEAIIKLYIYTHTRYIHTCTIYKGYALSYFSMFISIGCCADLPISFVEWKSSFNPVGQVQV